MWRRLQTKLSAEKEKEKEKDSLEQQQLEDEKNKNLNSDLKSVREAQLSKLFMLLSDIDAKQSQDFMGLGRKIYDIPAADPAHGVRQEEIVKFSDFIVKINATGKKQKRLFALTNLAIYNIHPKAGITHFNRIQRRTELKKLLGITLSAGVNDFVIHIKGEHDYWLQSPRRSAIVMAIAKEHSKITNGQNELRVEVKSEKTIHDVVVRARAGERTNTVELEKNNEKDDVRTRDSVVANTEFALEQKVEDEKDKSSTNSGAYSVAGIIRKAVSKKKIRYRENGFDLDLTYITDRVIAMGYPSDDFEGLYRNPYSEVFRFFETLHKDRYRIYNLCSERKYDASLFHRRVGFYPMDDHNVPSIELMIEFCKDMEEWLKADPKNVCAIHCKAGKGRTGLMVSIYLIYSGICQTGEEALDYFGAKRTSDNQGVTIPSQKRFAKYFENYMNLFKARGKELPLNAPVILVQKILFSQVPSVDVSHGSRPYLQIMNLSGDKVFDTREEGRPSYYRQNHDKNVELTLKNCFISGSCKFYIYSEDQVMDHEIMHFWLSTRFMPPFKEIEQLYGLEKSPSDARDSGLKSLGSGLFQICLKRNELDGPPRQKNCKFFDDNFTITLVCAIDPKFKILEKESQDSIKISVSDMYNKLLKAQEELAKERRRNAQLESSLIELQENYELLQAEKASARATRAYSQGSAIIMESVSEEVSVNEFESEDNIPYTIEDIHSNETLDDEENENAPHAQPQPTNE
jgi:phosphatidylinositol-3,4,5-trisphosphate 3-phosphatase/dual-specificity protein phosphatase PTEN